MSRAVMVNERKWPEPDLSEIGIRQRAKAAAGPICPYRSVVVDRKLRELGYARECVLEGRRVVSVVTIPLRASAAAA